MTTTATTIPHYARRDERGFYSTPNGDYFSVTTILGYLGKHHLLNWYAKMAAQDCADQAKLYVDKKIDHDEFTKRILDWPTRMRAAEIERDRKGRIGTLAHHVIYHHVLGQEFRSDRDIEHFMVHEAMDMRLLVSREGEVAPKNDYQRLASMAAPYAASALEWIRKYKPQFDMVGMEAMGVNDTYGYAGTIDSIATLSIRNHLATDRSTTGDTMRALRVITGTDTPRVQIDFKTSNAIQDTYLWQIEAYANFEAILIEADATVPESDTVWLGDRRMYRGQVGDIAANCILHIGSDSCELYAYERSPEVFEWFLGLQAAVEGLVSRDPEYKDRRKPARQKLPPKTRVSETPKRLTAQKAPF